MANKVIETRSGLKVDMLKPNNDFSLEDIAHSLSLLCRFNGHCKHFYSVAAHSMLVTELVKQYTSCPHTMAASLLHDATEAYIGDIITPVKDRIKGLAHIEHTLKLEIMAYFGVDCGTVDWDLIKDADNAALRAEASLLMSNKGHGWDIKVARPYHINTMAAYLTSPTLPMKWKQKFHDQLVSWVGGPS